MQLGLGRLQEEPGIGMFWAGERFSGYPVGVIVLIDVVGVVWVELKLWELELLV